MPLFLYQDLLEITIRSSTAIVGYEPQNRIQLFSYVHHTLIDITSNNRNFWKSENSPKSSELTRNYTSNERMKRKLDLKINKFHCLNSFNISKIIIECLIISHFFYINHCLQTQIQQITQNICTLYAVVVEESSCGQLKIHLKYFLPSFQVFLWSYCY